MFLFPCWPQVNNLLKFLMQLYFKPTTAKMLSNLKVRARLPLCVLLSSQGWHSCATKGTQRVARLHGHWPAQSPGWQLDFY